MRPIALLVAALLPLSAAALAQPAGPHPLAGDSSPGPGDQRPDVPDLQLLPHRLPDVPIPGLKPPDAKDSGTAVSGAPQAKAPAAKPPETDDEILAKLAKATDKRTAQRFERELHARWTHSGSPSADLLYKRAGDAMDAHDLDTARAIVDKLTDIAPEFSEAWHLRATLASQKDDYADAIAALRRTLTLRPNEFMALAELGEILEEYDDKPHALEAYKQAKALDPFIDGIDDRIRKLTKDVEGQGI
jgi:hypothetical protein